MEQCTHTHSSIITVRRSDRSSVSEQCSNRRWCRDHCRAAWLQSRVQTTAALSHRWAALKQQLKAWATPLDGALIVNLLLCTARVAETVQQRCSHSDLALLLRLVSSRRLLSSPGVSSYLCLSFSSHLCINFTLVLCFPPTLFANLGIQTHTHTHFLKVFYSCPPLFPGSLCFTLFL